MHGVFDIESAMTRNFKPIPSHIEDNSNVRLRICLDGPNNSGKTTFGVFLAPQVLMYAQKQHESEFVSPVVVVEEPPRIWVDLESSIGKATYRNVAKEHIAISGVVDEKELQDRFVQANTFLAGRRRLHEITAFEFPLSDNYGSKGLWKFVDGSAQFRGLRSTVQTRNDLLKAGGMDVIHIRGTASTLVYQGSDAQEGERVRKLIDKCYRKRFLAPDDLTLIIHPDRREAESDSRTELGERVERDAHEGILDELSLYSQLTGKRSFTRNIIHLFNRHPVRSTEENLKEIDRGGIRITNLALFFLLIHQSVLENLQKSGRAELPREVGIKVQVSIKNIFGEVGNLGRISYHDSLLEVLEAVERLRTNKPINQRVLRSGDVEITSIEDNSVGLVIHK